MSSELKEILEKASKQELEDALHSLLSPTSLKKRTVDALENQANEITEFLTSYSIVENLDDKDDKTFDRAKMFLKELPELTARIEALKLTVVPEPEETSLKKRANKNSVLRFVREKLDDA